MTRKSNLNMNFNFSGSDPTSILLIGGILMFVLAIPIGFVSIGGAIAIGIVGVILLVIGIFSMFSGSSEGGNFL